MFTQEITRRVDHFENHSNVLEGLKGLIQAAKELHSEERKISLLSVRLVGLLIEQNGPGNSNMNQQRFAWHIGLTPSIFWKRAQTYRVLKKYPEFSTMIERGEICVSHVSIFAKKITLANADVLAESIKYKSTREVQDIVASIGPDGSKLDDAETFIDIRLRLTKSQAALLERAREVLAHGGSVPRNEEIILRALSDLLERKDPMKKAERAEKRSQRTQSSAESGGATSPSSRKEEIDKGVFSCADLKKDAFGEGWEPYSPSARKEAGKSAPTSKQRPKIPAATKHLVWQRDQGCCTHKYSDDFRCCSRMMIEIDHIIPWAKGGSHAPENLALKCREHNQQSAVNVFGREHMEQYWN